MARGYGTAPYGAGQYQGGDLVQLAARGAQPTPTRSYVVARRDQGLAARAVVGSSGAMLLDVFSPLVAMGAAISYASASARLTTERAVAPASLGTTGHTTSNVDRATSAAETVNVDATAEATLLWGTRPKAESQWGTTQAEKVEWLPTQAAPTNWD